MTLESPKLTKISLKPLIALTNTERMITTDYTWPKMIKEQGSGRMPRFKTSAAHGLRQLKALILNHEEIIKELWFTGR